MGSVWAVTALLALVTTAAGDDQEFTEPVCGHHEDVRGFSLDLPASLCGHRYLHGFWIALPPDGVPDSRSIVVWASRNANFYKKSRDIAVAAVDAQKSAAVGGVQVVARESITLQGVPAERWRYGFRSRTDRRNRLVEVVAVLWPLRSKPSWSDYYEYSISLNTTPEDYAADARVFEAVLASLTFSEPGI